MKLFASIFILLLCLAPLQAQDKQQRSKTDLNIEDITPDYYEECRGNGFPERQDYWRFNDLKVVNIVDANSIIIEEIDENRKTKRYTVNLIGIDPKENNKNIKNFLLKNVLNQEIHIAGRDMNFGAIVVFNKNFLELNQYLLEQGLAKFKDFESNNLVPYRTPCIYQKVEEKARQAKIGIWSDQ
jgi:hypothetical protein